MNFARVSLLSLATLAASATAWTAPAADQRLSSLPTAVSGAYSLTFNINFTSPIPAGATIACKARIAPNLSSFNAGATPIESATGSSIVTGSFFTGSRAICAVEIPFSWTVTGSGNGVAVTYDIHAITPVGSQSIPMRAQEGIFAAYPAPGATASIRIDVGF